MPQQPITLSTYPHSVPLFAGNHRLVNLYAEPAEGPARDRFVLVGSPGMKEFADASATAAGQPCRGFKRFADTEYTVIGNFLFSYTSDGTLTNIPGNIAGTGPVSIACDNDEMVITTRPGTDDYIFDGTTLSQLTGANIVDFRDVDYIDGRIICVQASPDIPGRFSFSDVNALSTFGASSFANAESEPDGLLRGRVIDRLIWLFGENTLEPWYSTGDSSAPFERHADGIEKYGLASHDSVSVIGGTGFFLAKSQASGPHVRMIRGSQSVRVSTNALDRIIASGTFSDAEGAGYEDEGHIFYALTLPTADRTFVYDATIGFWHERQSGTDIVGSWDARQCIVAHDKVIVGHKDDGKLYELDFDTQTDAGAKRIALWTAELSSSGEVWNRLDEVLVDMTVGEAAAGATVEPQVMMRISRDGGRTFGPERWRGIGFSGDYDRQVKWHGCGAFRHGLLEFRITDSVPREITKVHARGRPGRPV